MPREAIRVGVVMQVVKRFAMITRGGFAPGSLFFGGLTSRNMK